MIDPKIFHFPIFCIFFNYFFHFLVSLPFRPVWRIRDIEIANGKVSVILWSYVASWLYFLMMYIGFLIVFRSLSNHLLYIKFGIKNILHCYTPKEMALSSSLFATRKKPPRYYFQYRGGFSLLRLHWVHFSIQTKERALYII